MSLFRGKRSKKRMQKGLTLIEMMVTLLLTTIIMGILYVVLTSTFKISGQVQTQLAIDEEVMRLNSNIQYLISRNWTSIVFDEEFDPGTLTLESRFPMIFEATLATITYQNEELVFIYQNSESSLATTLIAESLVSFRFVPANLVDVDSGGESGYTNEQYLYYEGIFQLEGASREITGAVRIY